MPTQKQLENFALAVAETGSWNLPEVANSLQIDWEDVREEISKEGWFYGQLRDSYDRIKYRILDQVGAAAQNLPNAVPLPAITVVKFALELLDKNVMLRSSGQAVSGQSPGDMDDELGFGGDTKPPPKEKKDAPNK